MSIELSAVSEIIQHEIVEFYKKWKGEDLPPVAVLYGGINKIVVHPFMFDTSVYQILEKLRKITDAEKDVIVAGISSEVYMKEIKDSTQKKALEQYNELGGLNKDNAKDSLMIMLWKRDSKDQFFAVAEIEKPNNKIGPWIETLKNTIGKIPEFKVFA